MTHATLKWQRGMTLIEILVALAVTSFLLIGLFTVVQTMLLVSNNQNSLAQLQDNERLAMTRLGDVIQQTGYFTGQTTTTPSAALPAASLTVASQAMTFAANQAVWGSHVATPAPQDTITVRYYTGPLDSLINCDGSTSAAVGVVYNTFAISGGTLVCYVTTSVAGVPITNPAVPLVSGIQDMMIQYGVNTSGASGNPVDSYITANNMTAANWANVISVRVSLVLNNPLYNANGPFSQQYPQQDPYLQISRVIGVMNRA